MQFLPGGGGGPPDLQQFHGNPAALSRGGLCFFVLRSEAGAWKPLSNGFRASAIATRRAFLPSFAKSTGKDHLTTVGS